jgi:hypothetical protein
MKKSLLLLAALACSGAVAQEKEIWACQQVEGTMLFWENSSWTQLLINPKPLLLTIDGKNSSYKMGDNENELDCSFYGVTSCVSSATHLLIDKATGRMGLSHLLGALMSSSERRDSVSAEIYICTKF